MNVMMFATHDVYSLAELVARRLEREDHTERESYTVEPDHPFTPCKYCHGDQGDALLLWEWDRHDATSDGYDESCADWDCARAVLGFALLDTDPEGIRVGYPVAADPVYPTALAA
jgi:hypothetical protein